jgi:hypothetical protein
MRTRQKLAKLVRTMLSTSHPGERDNAASAINDILTQHGYSPADLDQLLATGAADAQQAPRQDQAPWQDDDDDRDVGQAPPPLDGLASLLREYLHLDEQEYLAVALWIIHTHVYDRFMVSPRLALVSPVRRCGKTTTLSLLTALCRNGQRMDGLTAAAIYRLVDREQPTLLCDEVDTYGLQQDRRLRGVFNSGHRRGGAIGRGTRDGASLKFSTFAPMAVAAIGSASLPLTVLDRSIIVRMMRADGTLPLKRLDELDDAVAAELDAMHRAIRRWAKTAALDRNPDLPLRNRAADNWRPLISIADACGGDWGAKARAAAVAMSRGLQEEDPVVTLLSHIRDVFDALRRDRIYSDELVQVLVGMDDAPWSEWRGIRDDQQPRQLTQAELARVLRRLFDIRPRSIWPPQRTPQSKSRKGYYRQQFEAAWRSYCGADTGGAARRLHLVSDGG